MLLASLAQNPLEFLAMIIAFVISLTLHEFCHGLVAKLEGDSTAEMLGRLTLNPLAHLDWLGAIMFLLVGFGWAKPVPIDYRHLRHGRWGVLLVSLAGPFANLLGAIFFGLVLVFLGPSLSATNLLTQFLISLVQVNLILMLFNLLPLPPLDGGEALIALLPNRWLAVKVWLAKNGPWVLLALVVADSVFQVGIFSRLFYGLLSLIAHLFGWG
jgi:Zn-dependent protease